MPQSSSSRKGKPRGPGGLEEVAQLPNGTMALGCPFCERKGLAPEAVFHGDDIETEPCPVCKGFTFNIVPASSEANMACRFCEASGRAWDENGHFVGEPCRVCGGRGFVDISAVAAAQASTRASDFWAHVHPTVLRVARSRFDAGHFADAAEATLKAFNEEVKRLARGKVPEQLDGAKLMTRVFSLENPILRLADLEVENGRNIQVGYMQLFAGAMTGIRNPKAHANLEIDAPRAIHFIYLVSLFFLKLDELVDGGTLQSVSPTS